VKKKKVLQKEVKTYYAQTDEHWRKEQKFGFLTAKGHRGNVAWREITPDEDYTWVAEGLSAEFETFIQIGAKGKKSSKDKDTGTVFRTFSLGVSTNRDSIVYDFSKQALGIRVEQFCDDYNAETVRYQQKGKSANIDDFVNYGKVRWSSTLKNHTKRGRLAEFDKTKIQTSLYRPFTRMFLYYDSILNDRPAHFRQILPTSTTEAENQVICVAGIGNRKGFGSLMTNLIISLDVAFEKTQCFPFYTYDEDGSNRRENITDWALEQFRTHYNDDRISKWDVFHYVYAVLYHPRYREKYAANLRRELPRIPFAPDFWGFAEAGAKLAELHVHYEDQAEHPLKWVENPDVPLNWRVEKMKLSKDKTQLIYNEFLTLGGIPPEAFEYRLGNRSALEWIVDQYRVKTDRRSGIVNDANRPDDPQYIVRLIGKVITVSLETVRIVGSLPELG